MNTIQKATLIMALAAAPAAAQITASSAYNTTHNTSLVRFERAANNSYAFLDLQGDKRFDLQSHYGEARFNVPIEAGFKLGVDFNFGSHFDDRAAAQLVYSRGIPNGFLETRVAKPVTNDSPVRIGYASATGIRKLGLSTWGSIDLHRSGAQFLGELEMNYDLGKDIRALVRREHYPWSGYATQIGLKTKF